jgi:competence protein ComEC
LILEKPKLFTSIREFIGAMAVLALVLILRLGWEYSAYRSFISQPLYYTHAVILNIYPKERNGKHYTVLKLRTEQGRTIYTTTWRKDLIESERVYVQLLPTESIGFLDYLGGMYCKSHLKRIDPPLPTLRTDLERWIADQHTDPDMVAFYKGIYLARPIPQTLRESIARLGVSHLVALSGFHLGILWALLYPLLLTVYRPFQRRYFPYRHPLQDIGLVVMGLIGYYLWLTGSPPSLVRSYAMLLVGWGMVLMGIELVSFTFLATIAMMLLALFPPLIVSLGFWLSILGVFYIFLILRYCQSSPKILVTFACIPMGIFILMQPLVHGIFGVTTPWQLLSPLLSLMFVFLYPLSFVLHLLGQGGVLDGVLLGLFSLPQNSHEHLIPLWGMIGYVLLSLLAIRWRWAFYVLLAMAVGYVGWVYPHISKQDRPMMEQSGG